jgi:hypothetical protein
MDLQPQTLAAIAAGVCVVCANVPYVWATWRRQARPNRATWFIYLTVGIVGCASMAAGGARETLVVPLLYAVGACAIFTLSLRHGEGGWSRLDQTCLATALASLVLWGLTGDSRVAVVLTAVADLAGTIPTIVKSWRDPTGEPRVSWAFYALGGALAVGSAPTWDITNVVYPASILIGCLAVNVGLWRGGVASPRSGVRGPGSGVERQDR